MVTDVAVGDDVETTGGRLPTCKEIVGEQGHWTLTYSDYLAFSPRHCVLYPQTLPGKLALGLITLP